MGKRKIRPQGIETPNLIQIKFGTVDYVGGATPGAKFHANPSIGASRQMGEIYAPNFYLHIPFFQKLTYSAHRLSYCFKMVFTADDKQLINSLRQLKGYSSRRFLKEFLQKN